MVHLNELDTRRNESLQDADSFFSPPVFSRHLNESAYLVGPPLKAYYLTTYRSTKKHVCTTKQNHKMTKTHFQSPFLIQESISNAVVPQKVPEPQWKHAYKPTWNWMRCLYGCTWTLQFTSNKHYMEQNVRGEFGIENIMIDTGWMKYGLCENVRVCTFSTAASSPLTSGHTSLGPNLV